MRFSSSPFGAARRRAGAAPSPLPATGPARPARSRSARARCAAAGAAVALACACASGHGGDGAGDLGYPPARTVDVVDDYHGTAVADPYRWLEADVRSDEEVAEWVRAQDRVARRYLAEIDARDRIAERLEELWNYPKRSAPTRHGAWFYAWHNSGLEAQARLVRADDAATLLTVDATGVETVLDPNTLSEDGTVAYAGGAFSDDGRWLCYGRSASGSDWSDWYLLDLETLEHVEGEVITGIKWGDVAWLPDSSGFFYARYDVPEEEKFLAQVTNQKIWFHELGTPQSQDLLIHEREDEPEWSFAPAVSDDGRWLVVHVWSAGTDNLLHVFDLENASAEPLKLVDRFTADYSYVGTAPTGELILRTDEDAPNGRILAVDPLADPPEWTEIVPEREWRLEDVDEIGGRIVASYLADASTKVVVYDFVTQQEQVDGQEPGPETLAVCEEAGTVPLPGIGTASGFEGENDTTQVFFTFSSFATPSEVHRLDLSSAEATRVAPSALDLDSDRYTVEQVWYESADGTRVPMFVSRRADLEPAKEGEGAHPTLLYGYGGFDISLTPSFSVSRLVWMEMGGVFAMPNLRGGGEFGEAWHRAGTRTNKQNVFDDFIAAGEWLVANGWTRPDRLAIEGGSNGGLLVGACLIQRPDLFGACHPAVGVMDMLRFHLFTAGRYWVDDYGSVDDPTEFEALLEYSPYHNLEDGASYPATLITTADTDDRVVPAHSFKFAARMQAAQGGDEPVLLRVESSAGHGAGKPTAKRIAETADVWAFFVNELAFEPWQ